MHIQKSSVVFTNVKIYEKKNVSLLFRLFWPPVCQFCVVPEIFSLVVVSKIQALANAGPGSNPNTIRL